MSSNYRIHVANYGFFNLSSPGLDLETEKNLVTFFIFVRLG